MHRTWIAALLLLLGAGTALMVHPPSSQSVTTVVPGAVQSGSALTGSSGTTQFSSAGRNWALSQSPRFDFDPLGRVDFPASPLGIGQHVWCFYITDIQVMCFGRAAPVTSGAIERYFSPDGGQTFRATSQSTGIWNAANNELSGVSQISTGGYLFVSGRTACTAADGPFYTTADGVAVTVRPCTGTFAGSVNHPTQQNVNTFLVPAGDTGANDFYCRSADTAATWQCQIMPAITGFTGTFWRWSGGGSSDGFQSIAPVSANTWVAIGNGTSDSVVRIIRSTDDGLNWTQVFSSGATGGFPAIQCLSSTVCLAAHNERIYRSVNGGVTWTQSSPGPSGTSTRWQGIAVFDTLTASVLPWGGGNGSGRADVAYTNDGGATWSFSLYSGATNGTCPNSSGAESGLHNIAVRNGRGLIISNYGALTSPFSPCVHYTSFGSGAIAIAGPLGVPLNITIDGKASVTIEEGCGGAVLDQVTDTNISVTANTQLITGVAGRRTMICHLNLIATGGANNVALVAGTGATCGTGTVGLFGGATAATGWGFAANGGLVMGNGRNVLRRSVTAGNNICILVSAATQVSGSIRTAPSF